MGRRFISRKKKKYKKRLTYFLLLLLLLLIIPHINKIKIKNSNNMIEKFLETMSLSYNLSENTIYKVINNNLKNTFNSPEYILKSELRYNSKSSKSNIKEVNFSYNENELPLVYIYNSHQGENYSNKYLTDYNIVPNVLTASYMLEEKLKNIGINTLVEENNILAYMKENNYDHSKSYIASRHFLTKTFEKYNSIKLYIDLHRDSVSHNYTTAVIDNKSYAKIMFVIGLNYNTYESNLSIANILNNKLNEKYPGLSRGILKKGNIGANGVYNQDLNPNIILIELGGYENDIDEINNTLEVLSIIIGEYINEKE